MDNNKDLARRMKEWYYERTNAHIGRVTKYAHKIADHYPEFKKLKEIVKDHDQTKFRAPEYIPYVFITWDYRCKREGEPFEVPQKIRDQMNDATEHHILNNKHHPEYWDKNFDPSMLNREDRDAVPETPVDASKMPDIYVAELCADWMGMSEELGTKPHDWAKKNVNVRWNFTDDQVKLIYDILDNIWGV